MKTSTIERPQGLHVHSILADILSFQQEIVDFFFIVCYKIYTTAKLKNIRLYSFKGKLHP